MSSKPSPTLSPPSEAPPPSYTESLTAPSSANPISHHRISTLITTHILPHLSTNNTPTTTLVLIPFDVKPLFCPPASTSTSHKAPTTPPPSSASYPGEKLVGFNTEDHPLLIRLSSTEGSLQFWRTASILRDLTAQLYREVGFLGYRIVSRGKIPVGLEWQSVRQAELRGGEARVHVEVKEVCLRVENEMGLYETRSGIAVVVQVELGCDDDDGNDEEGGFAAGCL